MIDIKNLAPGWHLATNNKEIGRDFRFVDFRAAFAFMSRVASQAEELNHHPDWSNSYNRVHIRLSTHSEKQLTELDFELAHRINRIFEEMRSEQARLTSKSFH